MSTASNRVIRLEGILQRIIDIIDEYQIIEDNLDQTLSDEFFGLLNEAREALKQDQDY